MTIRVLVVDDSVVIRRLVVQALESDPDVEVVSTAANGRLALAKVEQLRPDAVTMDIEMPEMNGVEAVRELRKRGHQMPIIMFSTLTERGATATLDALSAGASDYVAKPSNVGSINESLAAVADQLIPKIRALVPGARAQAPRTGAVAPARAAVAAVPAARSATPRQGARRHPVRAVVLGCSTGGPEALSRVVERLTVPLPVPMLVVQHMPAVFTRQLANRLDRLGPSTVVEAEDGQPLVPGGIYIAPGDTHLEVDGKAGNLRARITHGAPVNFCRPSVDVLFRSVLGAIGPDLLGVILTGMGADGKAGSGAIAEAGGTIVVQDEKTSVVWGMPGVTAQAGYAHRIVPILEIGQTISALVQASTGAQEVSQ
ncbi:response regulator receiver modulated CheB methylesterase [Sanguibacter keddieii DSM 10542]|uniref:Protein-glutamate methylesterase/protein-glutamine glutaminase n=1 Tax=Sanguibacter keddieii (strain ATCC 51767 / DSM 10542 / NCFB 3025 / ST-74) TaxID=446469 RepID=D1BCK1_SANKS|nr:chemotaxis response regulator protein-glutamate methylesterase [Sanguibacter keddieii]ACZ22988.1 response regulator receiver modulated CheB methylesterase [Sanguibacter keddieii DSM 10542]